MIPAILFDKFTYFVKQISKNVFKLINDENFKIMKKIILLLVAVAFSLTQLVAQTPTFIKGDKVLNLGIGLGSTLYSGAGFTGQIPPVSVSFEKGIVDNLLEKGILGIGGYLGYSSYKYENSNWGWKYSNIIVGARGSFHYPLVDKLDTYTGLLLGYNIATTKEIGTAIPGITSASVGGIVWSWYLGARYYFKENFGVMAELGYGISTLNLGISIKL